MFEIARKSSILRGKRLDKPGRADNERGNELAATKEETQRNKDELAKANHKICTLDKEIDVPYPLATACSLTRRRLDTWEKGSEMKEDEMGIELGNKVCHRGEIRADVALFQQESPRGQIADANRFMVKCGGSSSWVFDNKLARKFLKLLDMHVGMVYFDMQSQALKRVCIAIAYKSRPSIAKANAGCGEKDSMSIWRTWLMAKHYLQKWRGSMLQL